MWVPSVVNLALAPVRDLQRPDLTDHAHGFKNGFDLAIIPERMKGRGLHRQEFAQVIAPLMWRGQSEHIHATARRFVGSHGRDDFSPPAFGDLGSANRTDPDRAAGLKAGVGGRSMLDGLVHLDLFSALTDAQAVICP